MDLGISQRYTLCEKRKREPNGANSDSAIAGEQCFRLVYCVIRAFGEA